MVTHLPILSLLVLACCLSTLHAESGRKELRTKEANLENIVQMGRQTQFNRIDPSRVIQLSWHPRVFLYRGFLSEDECDRIISSVKGKMENPLGNSGDSGKIDTSKQPRSSEISFSMDGDIEAKIEERILAWTFLPKECGEPSQVLHFGLEDSKVKYDYFGNKSTLALDEPLMATVVLYLSNVSQGGQILFPKSEFRNSNLKNKIWSDCGKSSSLLTPTKGNAILFFSRYPNASLDWSSLHARCPVLEGEMWCVTKFFHVKAITGEHKKVTSQSEDGDCTDEDEKCPRWAAMGECQRNPIFMIGSPDYYGTCRKSCNVC